MSSYRAYCFTLPTIKISSKVDEVAWEELKQWVNESPEQLVEAIQDYARKRRVRPAVMQHLEDSIRDNQVLAHLLAK